ncbi:MAG: pseudouridine-5'-phosphate glycosidase [Planctomycetota bacterium]|nr:pseudouridine-5'-phosphate glycosidase [Planctomycetota bacterium]
MSGGRVVRIAEEIEDALAEDRPVVGLETAVLTHGLPRTGGPRPSSLDPSRIAGSRLGDFAWDPEAPLNLQSVRAVGRAVRESGAVPAVTAMIRGTLRIGLDDDELEELALDESAAKVSARDLGSVAAAGRNAGTTVAGSLRACRLAAPRPIRVFATGGIGGVHRGWQSRPDISGDLRALATEPVAVVAAGAKVILDVTATLEALDSLGVPVIGCATDRMPIFTAGVHAELRVPHRLDEPDDIALACRRHWNDFGLSSGVLVANPCPPDASADASRLDALVDASLAEASALGIDGADVTPFLLASMAEAEGTVDPLDANIALLVANASLAARIAIAMVDCRE